MAKISKKEYELFLNENGKSLPKEAFVIGGKMRNMPFGTALRKFEPNTFEMGYDDYCIRKIYAEYIKNIRK